MDALYESGVHVIAALQRMPIFVDHPYSSFWLFITKLGDPATLFTFHAPILFVFLRETSTFVQFFLASCISEFLNGVFKWILMADRPYWWISAYERSETLPDLKQFPPTCETGPGSPSGHCMCTAAAWIVLVLRLRGKSRSLGFSIYVLYLTLIALSRLYVATHFPHQVIFGAIVGAFVGWCCSRIDTSAINFRVCAGVIAVSAVIAAITYNWLKWWMGYDPNWSIQLAKRYCQNPNAWIHPTTTPFAGFMRDAGALIGLGIVAGGQFWTKATTTMEPNRGLYADSGLSAKLIGAILGITVGKVTSLLLASLSGGSSWWSVLCFYFTVAAEQIVLFVSYTVILPALVFGGPADGLSAIWKKLL